MGTQTIIRLHGTFADSSGRAVYCRSLTRIVGSNPAGEWMSVSCECCMCCQVEVSATTRSLINRSLPTVICHYVWPRNLQNKAVLVSVGLLRQREKEREKEKKSFIILTIWCRVSCQQRRISLHIAWCAAIIFTRNAILTCKDLGYRYVTHTSFVVIWRRKTNL
jgi:hypothetical protein